MPLTNNLRRQVDLPAWEQLRFAPVVSSALSASCCADNSTYNPDFGRYIYYLINATNFWRYDTWTDGYIQLASPPIAPLSFARMQFSGAQGFEGRVLSATASSFDAPAFSGNLLSGYDVRIISGTGKGQQRVIQSVSQPSVSDTGVVTAATASILTDSTKAWTVNQWQGFQVRVMYGTGVGQVRRILYNDATSLTLADQNRTVVDYNAQPMSPSPVFSATAGAQTIYAIESSTYSLESNWSVTPDATSRFRVFSGAITLVSSAAATPFFTIQVYDIASDTWYIRTATQSLLSAVGTDIAITRTTENASVWAKGLATSGTTTTLTDTTKNWVTDELKDRYIQIYSGTGEGTLKRITTNTATTITWSGALGSAIDTTSRYLVTGFEGGTATGSTSTTLSDSSKTWAVNQWKNYTVRIVSGTGIGQVLPIISNTSNALTLYKPWGTALDTTSNYIIQGDKDNTYLAFGGQASLFVHSLEADMAVPGRSVDDGLARNGSAQYGEWPPVPIASGTGAAGTITITTVIPHGFRTGWSITHRGDTGASAVQNNITASITVTGATTYTYTAPGSTAAWTLGAQSTTVLRDSSKNWTTNEHAGRICYFLTSLPATGSGSASMVAMQIASNTSNALTFVAAASAAPVSGTSRYVIAERATIGSVDNGIATGTQSTTTLQDTSKSWVVNRWAGHRVKMVSGTGQSQELAITSNTSNTLTFALSTAPVAGATSYSIVQATPKGLGTDLIWNFGASPRLIQGRYLYAPRGGAVIGFDRLDLTTDTWTLLSTSPQIETLTTGSMYAYDGGDRYYFTKDITLRVYYLDLNTHEIHGAGIMPYLAGTAILGNRMEIFETEDGLKYLWVNRHSNLDCFRQLLFY